MPLLPSIRLGILLSAAAGFAASCGAEPLFKSSRSQTPLLELFTSEGCSSCPPAETWIAALSNDPGLWKEFVPVAFHVDYWNSLGWRDRFSAPEFSDRQRAYGSAWGSNAIYTPGFVVNGGEWHWKGGARPAADAGRNAGILAVERTGSGKLSVTFDGGAAGMKATVALVASGLTTRVLNGENAGRTLEHSFTVMKLETAPFILTPDGTATAEIDFPKPPSVERGARYGLAVWASRNGTPVQAAGGWLPQTK